MYLRNRKHFPCFYRVIETRVEVWEKREIAWERNFEFLPNFHKCFYNSIGTRKKCFLFPLLNSLLKTIKKINLLILITKYCLYFIFLNSRAIHATRAKIPVFLSFWAFDQSTPVFLKGYFIKCLITYRILPTFPSCIIAPNGTQLVFYFLMQVAAICR